MDLPRIAALLAPFLGDATLSEVQLSQLSTYLGLLLRWNARINLTAVRDPEQIVPRHCGESFFTARSLYPNGGRPAAGEWLLDLGSGAGFPGLPIKIWVPALRVTLIESQYRKAIFLREVIRALALPAIDVFSARAEDFDWRTAQESTGEAAPAEQEVARAPSPPTIDFLRPHSLTITFRAVEKFDRALATAARLLTGAPAPSRRLALLIGAAQVPRVRQLVPGFTWSDPAPIPQSSNRVLLVGTHATSSI